MNNNLLNDNRFYMVFKDDKNKSHKAYHVVNGELVKTPEYEAHLAQYAKHNYTSEDYKNGKRKPIGLKVIGVVSLILILSYVVLLPILVYCNVGIAINEALKSADSECGSCGSIFHDYKH